MRCFITSGFGLKITLEGRSANGQYGRGPLPQILANALSPILGVGLQGRNTLLSKLSLDAPTKNECGSVPKLPV